MHAGSLYKEVFHAEQDRYATGLFNSKNEALYISGEQPLSLITSYVIIGVHAYHHTT